jgi:sulfide dehydrogenase cytochrome subunit
MEADMKRSFKITLIAGALSLALPLLLNAADGAKLAEKCADCHGEGGNSQDSDVPNIAGFSTFYFEDTMFAYREGDRTGVKFKKDDGTETDMNEVAKDLSDEEIQALAAHFAEKEFKSHAAEQKTDPALVKRGEEIFNDACEKCHADYGTDPTDDAGILAGQWMPYLRKQFELFASGDRYMPKKMKRKFEKVDKADYEAIIQALGSK